MSLVIPSWLQTPMVACGRCSSFAFFVESQCGKSCRALLSPVFNWFPKAAKLANYAKYQKLCDGLFVAFSLIFFLTRLVIFPFWYEDISDEASAVTSGVLLLPL